ncbi:alpha/beta fold hydrolase [Paenibacillus piri]|uniref:Alpha/beta hydrolase n=1 Tax=Paenibacillus piri TaxID=2547395 RepID=A0A4R5KUP6_9BACL|nr:alpha/beta hydrolase [Paenibacillus piri]TDF98848.1 alpha/beta hydrolase [Paenibacillus piri]
MTYFQHAGIRFHYIDEGEGMPFIFLHGLGGSVAQPAGLYKPIPGVRFISLDFRGHGETRELGDPDQIGFDTFSADVFALMHHLQLEHAVIGGISMGAGVALHFALNYSGKVRGLILSRIAWEDMPQPAESQRVFATVARMIETLGAERGKEQFRKTDIYMNMAAVSPDAADSLLRQFDYPHVEETWIKFIRIPADAPSRDRRAWSEIRVPTLILANQLDPIHPYAYGQLAAKTIPHAQFNILTPKSIDAQAHAEQTGAYVGEFLGSLLEGGVS